MARATTQARGVITAHNRPNTASNQPPKPFITVRREQPIDPEAKIYRFVTSASRNHVFKLVAYGDDSREMLALVEKAIFDLGTPYVRFYDWAYATHYSSVAALLMRRSQEARAEIWQDQESLMFACPNCGDRFQNSAEGREDFSRHMLEMHLELALPVLDLELDDDQKDPEDPGQVIGDDEEGSALGV